jgi:small conductance mechanosensitive channel
MILSELEVEIAPILAGLGIVGVAAGFGAQYLVEEINLRKTVLRDFDGTVHHVPNGEIKTASNFTRKFARVNLNISVAYGTDLDHAINVINRVGTEGG